MFTLSDYLSHIGIPVETIFTTKNSFGSCLEKFVLVGSLDSLFWPVGWLGWSEVPDRVVGGGFDWPDCFPYRPWLDVLICF